MVLSQRNQVIWANTHATLREQAAIATQSYVYRTLKPGFGNQLQTVPAIAIPTYLITATTQTAYPIALENFVGTIGLLTALITTSPLSKILDRHQSDIQADRQGYTLNGEPRQVSSLGGAVAYLPRQAIQTFAQSQGTLAVLNFLLMPTADSIEPQHQAGFKFLQRHSLLEGKNVSELSTRLLTETFGHQNRATLDRCLTILQRDFAALRGRSAFTQAEMVATQTVQSLGNWDETFNQRGTILITEVFMPDLEREIQAALLNPQQGAVWAERLLQALLDQLRTLIEAASTDSPRLEAAIQQAEQQVKLCQQQRSFANGNKRTMLHDALKQREVARLRSRSRRSAIFTLQKLREAVHTYTFQVQHIIETLSNLRRQVQIELAAFVDYRFQFEVPNGICLVTSEADFRHYYQKLLPDGGEAALTEVLCRQLSIALQLSKTTISNADLFTNAAAFRCFLAQKIDQTTQARSETLHILDELIQRPALLLELHRRAAELVPLKDSLDQRRQRWHIGLDDHPGTEEFLSVLNACCQVEYEKVHIVDRDRVYFLSHRWNFAYSDYHPFERVAQDAHREVTLERPYESLYPVVGDRGLPIPGALMTPIFAKSLFIKAAILENFHQDHRFLKPDPDRCGLCLVANRTMIPLSEALDRLCPRPAPQISAYALGVHLVSHYNALFQQMGATYLRQQISNLPESVAEFLTDEVKQQLLEELRHWERNVISQATEWA